MSASAPSASPSLPPPARGWRVAVVCVVGLLCLSAIAWVFWKQDLQYSRPTPVPAALRPPPLGSHVDLSGLLPETSAAPRLTLLHFYNPDCPCSRFNETHVADLQRLAGDRARFVIVAQVEHGTPAESSQMLARVQRAFPHTEILLDPSGAIAQRCGVYSTPQAVILQPGGALLYRGNYNVSRYCSDPATEFARVVLMGALAGHARGPLPPETAIAYGCQLPSDLSAATLPQVFTN